MNATATTKPARLQQVLEPPADPAPATRRGARTAVHRYAVTGRAPAAGPILLVLTGGRQDAAATIAAGELAARTRSAVVVVPAITGAGGFSVNALLHVARHRRIEAERTGIVERVASILSGGAVHWSIVEPVKLSGRRGAPTLSAGAVTSLLDRYAPAVLISTVPAKRNVAQRLPAPAAAAALPRR